MRRSRFVQALEPVPKLSWDIKEYPVTLHDGSFAKNHKSIHRDDNNMMLNLTKTSYHPVSNKAFFDTVTKIHEFSGFEVTGFQEFDKGKKVLAYLRNPSETQIGEFKSDNFMCLGNSFDYTSGFFHTIVNKVASCQNVFSKLSRLKSFTHSGNIEQKMEELILFFQKYLIEEEALTVQFKAWNGIQVSADLIDMFADEVIEIPKEGKISSLKKVQKTNLVLSINREVNRMGQNAYGLFNGLTYHTTHVKESSKQKVFGNVLGHMAKMNNLGYEFLERELEPVLN